jgi:hypothetical protein
MKIISPALLKGYVLESAADVCVSLYLPLGKTFESRVEAPRRLAKALAAIEERLTRLGPAEVKAFMKPLRSLVSRIPLTSPGETLAIFRSPRVAVAAMLPERHAEMSVVADSFHVRPLLAHFREGGSRETSPSERRQRLRRLRKAFLRGRLVWDLGEIARAAALGKIRSLWLRPGVWVRGGLDRKSGAIALDRPSEAQYKDDVLDDIAEIVMIKGGEVSLADPAAMAEVASGASAVAILRRSA